MDKWWSASSVPLAPPDDACTCEEDGSGPPGNFGIWASRKRNPLVGLTPQEGLHAMPWPLRTLRTGLAGILWLREGSYSLWGSEKSSRRGRSTDAGSECEEEFVRLRGGNIVQMYKCSDGMVPWESVWHCWTGRKWSPGPMYHVFDQ